MTRPLVLQSIETPGGDRCVDIFRKTDGSFGFDGYRRDPEDTSGWFAVTNYGEWRFDSEAEAFEAASRVFPWIAERAGD